MTYASIWRTRGARTFPGNPYDGHLLSAQLEQTRILLEDVERSRYAERSPAGCPRITLHAGSFVVKGPILQYFVKTSQHDERFSRAVFPAV